MNGYILQPITPMDKPRKPMDNNLTLNLTLLPPITFLAVRTRRRSRDPLPTTSTTQLPLLTPTPNNTTTLRPLHPTPKTNITVQNERPDHPHPAPVAGQRLVELARDGVQLVQSGPGDCGKIVVLVVQAHVVGEDIQWAVVGVCLRRGEGVQWMWSGCFGSGFGLQLREGFGPAVLHVREEVVLGDEVAGAGVQGSGEEGAGEQVVDRC